MSKRTNRKVKMPSSIVVLGKRLKIVVKDLSEEDALGQFRSSKLLIEIDKSQMLDKKTARETLLHEIVHAILFITGQTESLGASLEEAIVRSIEHGLTDVIHIKGLDYK